MSVPPIVTNRTFIDQQSEELDLDAVLDEAFDELEGFEPPPQTENANVEPPPSIITPQPTPNVPTVDQEMLKFVNTLLEMYPNEVQNKERLKDLLVGALQGDKSAEEGLKQEFPDFVSKYPEEIDKALSRELFNSLENDEQVMESFDRLLEGDESEVRAFTTEFPDIMTNIVTPTIINPQDNVETVHLLEKAKALSRERFKDPGNNKRLDELLDRISKGDKSAEKDLDQEFPDIKRMRSILPVLFPPGSKQRRVLNQESIKIMNALLGGCLDNIENKDRFYDLWNKILQGDLRAIHQFATEYPNVVPNMLKLSGQTNSQKKTMTLEEFIKREYDAFFNRFKIQETELNKEQKDVFEEFILCINYKIITPKKRKFFDLSKLETFPLNIKKAFTQAYLRFEMLEQTQDENLDKRGKQWKENVKSALQNKKYGLLGRILKKIPRAFDLPELIQLYLLSANEVIDNFRETKEELKSSLIKDLEEEKKLPNWNQKKFESVIDLNLSSFAIKKVEKYSYGDYEIALKIAGLELLNAHREYLEPAVAFCVRMEAATNAKLAWIHYLLTLDENERAPLFAQLQEILFEELEQLKN